MKVCVECGAVKKEANGWLSTWKSGGTFMSRHMEHGDNSPEFDIVCGDNCAHRRYQQFLDYLRNSQS